VAIPFYWLRHASTLLEMAGVLILSYALFVLLLLMLPGGREFLKMLRSIGGMIKRR
jgi:hypothetical protein